MAKTRLLQTSDGTNTAAFSLTDWSMLITVALTWGASFLFIDIGLDAFPPAVVGFGRIALGALALSFVPAARRPATAIDRADVPRIALLGLIWMAIPLTLFPIAGQWISSALAGMLNGGMPIITAVVATALGLRRPGRIQIIGLAVGFVGVALISAPSLAIGGDDALGVVLVLGALVCYAFSANLAVPLQQKYGGLALMLRVEAIGAALTLPGAVWFAPQSTFKWSSIIAVLALGVLGTGVAFAVMASIFGRVGATRGSTVTYLMPPVSIALGVRFRNDHIEALALVGIVVVLVGAFLVSRTTVQRASKQPAGNRQISDPS